MNKKQIITSIALIWALSVSTITFAQNSIQTGEINSWTKLDWKKSFMMDLNKNFWFDNNKLNIKELNFLKNMTPKQKKEFFEKKLLELKQKMEQEFKKILAKEAVIDKLLNWETLTTEDKVLVKEIKKDRANIKANLEKIFNAELKKLNKKSKD